MGNTGVFEAFQGRLELVARSAAGVLLVGESGAGKGRAARRLHRLGPRAGGPLVEVALSSLAPTLIEAELFGHVEGAFTGARGERPGRFRQAEGGTLVLDDIDTLPPEVQVKLLRVLQERVVEPVGAETGVDIDVRVVATTQLDPVRLVADGRLRSDLYYRLAVVVLHVPPLRARRDELPALCAEITAELARVRKLPALSLALETLQRLEEYSWPGNVRELENAIERALVLRAGDASDAAPLQPGDFGFLGEATDGAADELARAALAHGLSAAQLEQALLRAALAEERGNLSAAARRLGLSRRAAEYRLAHGAPSAEERPE